MIKKAACSRCYILRDFRNNKTIILSIAKSGGLRWEELVARNFPHPLGRPRKIREDGIKMDIMGIGSKVRSLWNCLVNISVREFVGFPDSASIEQVC
jgi:hypothetical protein